MILGKLVSNDERINEVNDILKEVFIDEMKSNQKDMLNITGKKVFHALLYEGLKEDRAVAVGRLELNKNEAYIKYVAVRKDYRRKKYGDMIVRMLVDKAQSMSLDEIYAEVPYFLTDMFEKIGFKSHYEEKNSILSQKYIIMKYCNKLLNCCKNIKN
ncbi:MAG TPA: GNAT family N-acetyltransferase [Mobilitalea sp.]|nr:GNAT family N-acetyltransferase [Mobilitalea sp.]